MQIVINMVLADDNRIIGENYNIIKGFYKILKKSVKNRENIAKTQIHKRLLKTRLNVHWIYCYNWLTKTEMIGENDQIVPMHSGKLKNEMVYRRTKK